MHTGDLATMDGEGYVNIVGRTKDMIVRGGENIYPREIEEFLYAHPLIQEVQIIGVPDEKYGEEVMAWVILKPGREATADDVRRFNPKVPPGMVVVLNRMMAKRPDDRYQTPDELLKDLEDLPSGPVLSPRELLEALALDSGTKPRPHASRETKASPSDSMNLFGQPLLPGELPKLRYRHAKIRAKKERDLEGSGDRSWMPVMRRPQLTLRLTSHSTAEQRIRYKHENRRGCRGHRAHNKTQSSRPTAGNSWPGLRH